MALPASSTAGELSASPNHPSRLIFGTGEMADRVRAFDWSRTSLGPIASWPDTLLTSVNILLSSRHPLFLWWGPDLIQFYNDAYRPSLGRDKHPKALGQRGHECWKEVWDSIGPQINSVLHDGNSTWNVDQYLPIYRNGDQLEDAWWTFSYSPIREASGHISGIFVVVSETTSRVLAERELHKGARDLRESERIGKMGSWRLVLATGDLTWSEEVYRLTEHDPSLPVLNYATQPEIIEPDSNRRLQAAVANCIATGQSYELDTKMYLPSGKVVWFATRGEPVFDAEGKVAELRGTVRDITDRKLAEEALRSSEQRLQLALESAHLGTWSYDEETGISTGDAAMQRIFGADRAAGDFNYWIEFCHPEDREAIGADFLAALSGQAPYETEYRIIRPTDGEVRWIRSLGRILREPGTPLRMLVVVEDITERKRTDAALLRTEKLAAVGRLASSIAHEINNPLESVTNLLYLAKTATNDPSAMEYLLMAEQELRRASAITSQTLRFHKQSTRPIEVTFDDLIVNALGILRSRIQNANVTVQQRNSSRCPVLCLDGEIRQVVSNLLINAVDAMHPRGGTLFLRCREGHDIPTQRPGLIFTVADTGPGMSPETHKRIFEPFFTTKGVSGTGLGLWISKEIIERHHGRLSVRSSQRPGRNGTVFTIFLPFEAAVR